MAKALGVGGVFFKSKDPKKLMDWYSKWLGFETSEWGAFFPQESMPATAGTAWTAFTADSDHFAPSGRDFSFNLIVDNLDEALAQVQEGGAQFVGEIQRADYGCFGSFLDPDGNKIELWQPA